MIKIKELADKFHISTRAIRFYEEKGLLSPDKDEQNQYRYYRQSDAWRLQTILSLRELGFSLEEIKGVLDGVAVDDDPEQFIYLLELQRAMMYGEWLELQKSMQIMEQMISDMKQRGFLDWQRVFTLADESRQWKKWRESWKDRWHFDKQADFFDQMVSDSVDLETSASDIAVDIASASLGDYELVLNKVVEWLSPREQELGLDLATGTGNLAGKLIAEGVQVVGIDQSKGMLRQAERKFPNLETKIGNFLAIPYPDHSFDFIVTSFAFHHLSEQQKVIALSEMQRVLKRSGRICMADFMFKDLRARQQYLQQLEQEHRLELIAAIEDKFYTDRSQLLSWFRDRGYVTKEEQINNLTHIVYALPIL